jgi:hypothetical protein
MRLPCDKEPSLNNGDPRVSSRPVRSARPLASRRVERVEASRAEIKNQATVAQHFLFEMSVSDRDSCLQKQ